MVFLFLIYNKNANNIVIHLPYSSQEGRSIYRGLCSHCHGISKEGSMGPSLLKINEKQIQNIIDTIRNGRDKMPKFDLSDKDLANLIGYLIELK